MKATTVDDILYYDRSEKSWTVTDREGQVHRFGSGGRAKQEAHRAAVAILRPTLHRMVTNTIERHPDLASRAWKAAQIVLDGDIEIVHDGIHVATVQSQSSIAEYRVNAVSGLLHCTCPDVGYTLPAGHTMCKHSMAYVYARKITEQDEAPY